MKCFYRLLHVALVRNREEHMLHAPSDGSQDLRSLVGFRVEGLGYVWTLGVSGSTGIF